MGRRAMLRVVAAAIALLIVPAAASANCGIAAEPFYTSVAQGRSPGSGRIDTAFVGTVVDARGPRHAQTFTIHVDEQIAGVILGTTEVVRSGYVTCGWFEIPSGPGGCSRSRPRPRT